MHECDQFASARFAHVETVFGTEVAGSAISRFASGGVSLASISAAAGATRGLFGFHGVGPVAIKALERARPLEHWALAPLCRMRA
jgi:hypothetical protein